nr:hypothetical protein MmNV_06 [Menippe mercenaria nudivirus]
MDNIVSTDEEVVVNEYVEIPSLLLVLTDEAREHAIVNYIKLREFTKNQDSIVKGHPLILYNLEYSIHRYYNLWSVLYSYVKSPNNTSQYDIAISVPCYTKVILTTKVVEDITRKPPTGRKVIFKPKRVKQDPKHKQSIYTAFRPK